MNLSPLKNHNGFTIVEQLVVLAIVGILISMSAGFLPSLVNSQKKTNITGTLNILRAKFISHLRDYRSRTATIQDTTYNNGVFDCLRDGLDCSGVISPVAFSPLRSDDSLIMSEGLVGYDPRNNPGHGFTIEGTVCTTFDVGDNLCPLRLNMTWQPICPEAPLPCVKPTILIQLTFQLNYGGVFSETIVDTSQLSTSITIPGTTKVGFSGDCPNGEVVVRVSGDGQLFCDTAVNVFGAPP